MKYGVLALASAILLAGIAGSMGKPTEDPYYDLHIIAVDRDGSALHPGVSRTKNGFKARPRPMRGEQLEDDPFLDEEGLPEFRVPYYEYVSRILEEIRRKKPRRVVFYIHGGNNFITGAIAKGAHLAEDMRGRETEEYRISICWSSNLFSTYQEHLAGNVEGLSSRVVGPLTAPLTLLSDVGGAIFDAPRTLVRLLSNDLNAAHPWAYSRNRQAMARQAELEWKQKLQMKPTLSASLGTDERSLRPGAIAMDVAAWTVTKPSKVATAPLIDQLGSGAWQMMLRRTRTMFERETVIANRYFERQQRRSGPRVVVEDGKLKRTSKPTIRDLQISERVQYAGRLGAVRLFFEEAERLIVEQRAAGQRVPELTIVGHSMGAIVTNEILARSLNIDFDEIVFLAAACTINDFVHIGVPYLRQHPRARFYNLCLHPAAERSEAQPAKLMIADPVYLPLEIAPRGTLLVWIDSFFDSPASEGDRTLGRWENAILMADAIPKSVLHRMTLKGFGRDRTAPNTAGLTYTKNYSYRLIQSGGLSPQVYLAEPREHGQFTRISHPDQPRKPTFDFTSKRYRRAEPVHPEISRPQPGN